MSRKTAPPRLNTIKDGATEGEVINTKSFNTLLGVFNKARSMGITGTTAQNIISSILVIKLLCERVASRKLDIGDPTEGKALGDAWKAALVPVTTANTPEPQISNALRKLIARLKTFSPSFSDYLLPPSTFNTRTEREIFEFAKSIDGIATHDDSFGRVYEFYIGRTHTGKDLGQFFTPQSIREMLVAKVNPQRFPDGSFPTFFDPAAGTGGFFASIVSYLQKTGSTKGIGDYIYACELNDDTFFTGRHHMLTLIGELTPNYKRCDGIHTIGQESEGIQIPPGGFDYVFSNPPFGMDNMKPENTECPIHTNWGTLLFLQRIVQVLKIGGRAAVILPTGTELKGNETKDIRRWLMTCCQLEEFITLPDKSFRNTSVSTCAIVFTKRVPCEDVVKVKNTKRKQNITFLAPIRTGNVVVSKFDGATIKEFGQVTSEQIEAKHYLWEMEQIMYRKEVSPGSVPLSSLFTITRGKPIKKENYVHGEVLVVGGGRPIGKHNVANTPPGGIILISASGYAGTVSFYSEPVFATGDAFVLSSSTIPIEHAYFVLKYIYEGDFINLAGGGSPKTHQ